MHTYTLSQTIKKINATSNFEVCLKPNSHEANASKFTKFTGQPMLHPHDALLRQPLRTFSPLCCHGRQEEGDLTEGVLYCGCLQSSEPGTQGTVIVEKQYGAWVMCSALCQVIPHPLFWGNSRAREQNEESYLFWVVFSSSDQSRHLTFLRSLKLKQCLRYQGRPWICPDALG